MERRTLMMAAGLTVAILATLYGQWVLREWYVEDAAISFAFARNWGDGWGLVRYPGDERVEGFSNPSWTALLALGQVLGIDPFDSSKWMAVLLAPVALCATFATALRDRLHWAIGLVAAMVLATDATFVIWSASGLENALFSAFLALGLWATLREGQSGGFTWSALAFLGLALTRPDGIAYAALGGGWALVLEATGARRWRRIGTWLAVFWVPFLLYHGLRYSYFAFPLPATFYAKLDGTPYWWRFHSFGWTYLRNYSFDTWRTWLLPIFLLGVVGSSRWRAGAVLVLSLISAVVLLLPGVEPLSSLESWPKIDLGRNWSYVKSFWVFGLALFAPLLAIRAPHWRLRIIAWAMAQFGLFFVLISNGDWMRGFRWVSLIAVPLALLFALGVHELVELGRRFLPGRAGPITGSVLGGLVIAAGIGPQIAYQQTYRPETTPFSVDKRVKHYRWALRMMYLDRVDIVDHDMGAMLYWAGDMGIVRDSKGLADIAFAYHNGERNFVAEYAFDEYPFDFAHGHASTQRLMSRLGKRWRDEYYEFPGYGGHAPHGGNYVRKSLFVHPWKGDDARHASFDTGVELHGLELPNDSFNWSTGLHVSFAMSRTRNEDFQVLFFLYDDQGQVWSASLPQGFAYIYPVEVWRSREVVNSEGGLRFPQGMPFGTYHMGAVILGPDGILEPLAVGPGVTIPEQPLFAPGEIRFDGVVHHRPAKEIEASADRLFATMGDAARDGRCEEAEALWWDARTQLTRVGSFWSSHKDEAYFTLAGCWVQRAHSLQDRDEVADAMRRALHWERTHPAVLEAGPTLSAPWYDEALDALSREDHQAAHELLVDVIAVDPSNSWARRRLEDLRRIRLDIQ